MKLIPVKKNLGSINLRMFKEMERKIIKQNSVLIFPEGTWKKKESELKELKQGAAYSALRFNLPILPVYISGATSWRKSTIKVAIGNCILPIGNRASLTRVIEKELQKLKVSIV